MTLRTQGGFALGPAPCRAAGTRVFLTSGGQFQLLDDVRAPTVRHDGDPAIHVTIALFLVAVLAIKGCDGTVPTVSQGGPVFQWSSVPVVHWTNRSTGKTPSCM